MQETFIYINTNVSTSNQDNFRIWITTEVHPKFSISLLQISIHFTYEPPEGKIKIKNNTQKVVLTSIINLNIHIKYS